MLTLRHTLKAINTYIARDIATCDTPYTPDIVGYYATLLRRGSSWHAATLHTYAAWIIRHIERCYAITVTILRRCHSIAALRYAGSHAATQYAAIRCRHIIAIIDSNTCRQYATLRAITAATLIAAYHYMPLLLDRLLLRPHIYAEHFRLRHAFFSHVS